MWKRFWIILSLLTIATVFISRYASESLSLSEIFYVVAWLLFISFLIAGSWEYFRRPKIRQTVKHALIWFGIFLSVTLMHTYRFELIQIKDRVLANLFPGRSFEKNPGMMNFPISPDGHFYIQAMVNGVAVRFLADTGASDIVLTPDAAKRLGFDPEQLSFDRIYQTANGMGRGATIQLAEMTVGELRLENIRASVNESPMSASLLGMSFFNRLKAYKVKNGILTLYYN